MTDKPLKSWVIKHPILSFVVLTYWLAYAVWGLILWHFGQTPIEDLFTAPTSILMIYLGAGAPALVAIFLTAVASGRAGLRDLGRRFIRAKVNVWIWVLALGIPFAVAFAATFLFAATSDSLGVANYPAWYAILPLGTIALFFAGPLCEETGWRGYLQPHLLAHTTPIKAILFIGVVWCFWHIPLSFTPGTTPELHSASAWALYCVSSIATTAILMALVVAARGSILIAMAFHWASNAALGSVVMPLYPAASDATWDTIGMIQLGLTILIGCIAIVWLYGQRSKLNIG